MAKKKKTIYEAHPRDYTMVGISAVSQYYCTKEWKEFSGRGFSEFISVIQDGKYAYYTEKDFLLDIARSFVKTRLNKNKVDLDQLWNRFDFMVDNYSSLINLPDSKYSKYMLLDFYDYYEKLLGAAYMGAYAVEYIDEVKPSLRKKFSMIAEKIRRKGELIYKEGESKFIPRYLKWLSKNELPDYPPELLKNVFCKEMENWLLGDGELPGVQELKKRQKLFIVRQYPADKYELYIGSRAKKYFKTIISRLQKKIISSDGLKGTVAQPGKVIGIAKIIKYHDEMAGFKHGQILISPMTQPSFLPAIKKAGAIVTDEGGVLSHAAIVARELKKPCIIGTRLATRFFKNGDRVIVDARTGIVKKITK